MINECQTVQDFEQILQHSQSHPVFLFKYSTACLTSTRAWNRFKNFAETEKGAEFWRVLVIQQRPLSRQIAQHTGIAHESPQVLLFQGGQVTWHAAHGHIREEVMRARLQP
ncbi:MAG: bacillithiol system redox-active protein YtxJ [bacterium]